MRRRAVLGFVAGGLVGFGGCARRQPEAPKSAPEHPGDEGRSGDDGSGDTETPPRIAIADSEFRERNGVAVLFVTARNTASQPHRVVLVANVEIDGESRRLQRDLTFDPHESREVEFSTAVDWESFEGTLLEVERVPVEVS